MIQERERVTARLVGFSSPHDEGVFTHMGSRTHVHCVVEEPLSTGHVDHLVPPAGTTIRFPADKESTPAISQNAQFGALATA